MTQHQRSTTVAEGQLVQVTAERKSTTWKSLLVVLPLIAVLAGSVALWRRGFFQDASSRERLIATLQADGPKGPLFCVAAQFAQVVIFVIPGEVTQPVAGYVFGLWPGFFYSALGIVLGSAFNFGLARILGRPALERFVNPTTLDKVDRTLASAKSKSALFLLFLLPGAPKDLMCYGAGFSKMSVAEFLCIAGLGRAPALFGSVLMGARAARHDYRSVLLTGIVLISAIACFYLYERRRRKTSNCDNS